jgi:O-antigen/teichoic acid export membrane protein
MSTSDLNLQARPLDGMPGAVIPAETLSHRTAKGFAWMAGQSIAAKAVTTVGQIVLAWLLMPDDFGLAAVAYMFSVVPLLVQQGGIREVLIRRHRHIDEWVNPAFWMSMTLGMAGGVIMAGLAPLAANWYNEPKLLGLTLIVAALFPLDSLSIVPMASLYGHMRFRVVATVLFGQAVLQTTLMIMFAAMDFGAFSLILPRPIMAVATAIVLWIAAPARLRLNPEVRRWRLLIADGGLVIGANACDLVLMFSPYLILSVLFDFDTVGLYYFAFNLSLQTQTLITQSLSGVLFPALNKLHDEPQRQAAAFLRASRVLACVMIPACLVQAALSDPVVRIVFQPKWEPAIPLLVVLSIAMALKGTGWPAAALFQAQNRFAARLRLAVVSVVLFVSMAWFLAWWRGPLGLVLAVLVHAMMVEPLTLLFAIRHGGKTSRDLVRAFGAPLLMGVLTAAPAWAAGQLVPGGPWSNWARAAVVAATAAAIYVPLLLWRLPDVWEEGRVRLTELRKR